MKNYFIIYVETNICAKQAPNPSRILGIHTREFTLADEEIDRLEKELQKIYPIPQSHQML